MRRAQLSRRLRRRFLPPFDCLFFEWCQTLIAARQVGQETVDSSLIEGAHRLHSKPSQFVSLIKPRRQNEDPGRTIVVECQQ